MADFQHWFGVGHAPRFSREVAQASAAVGTAQEALRGALERGYPLGAEVYVVHHRGCFHGTVEGWDIYGCRVLVKNSVTRKTSKWWAAHVELVNASGVPGTVPADPDCTCGSDSPRAFNHDLNCPHSTPWNDRVKARIASGPVSPVLDEAVQVLKSLGLPGLAERLKIAYGVPGCAGGKRHG